MSKEITDLRKEEIINACEKLYENNSFKDITIKLIGEETTFSRPSIYNYFQTKEEIFLAILQREYEKWIEELTKVYNQNESIEKEEFADTLAKTIEKRHKLLKLLSMNMYDMEENSRIERLTEFKKIYGNSIQMVRNCLDKFFTDMEEKDKDEFIFSFFPSMFGIYPYAVVTEKQKQAMKEANVPYKYYSIYEIARMCIRNLLKI